MHTTISTDSSHHSNEQIKLLNILKNVSDPEIPVLSIDEIGILRGVDLEGSTVVVTITPTYSGCPALDQITSSITSALSHAGYPDNRVELVLSPAWTTDWLTETARQKLHEYGIAPPCHTDLLARDGALPIEFTAPCPQCGSVNTKQLSEFGSTACKALWQCQTCLEPFDFFKPI